MIHEALQSLIPEGSNLKGNKFLSGQQTSAFQKEGKELVSELTTTAGAAVSAVNVVSLSGDQLSKIAQSMATAAIEEITKFTGKKIAEFTTKSTTLVTSIPGKIASNSIERFNSTDESIGDIKKSLGNVIGDLSKNKEDIIKNLTEKTEEKIKSDKINEVQKSTAETLTKAKEFVQKANDEIYKVMEYAAEGPAYVAEQMSRKIESIEENIEKTLNEQYSKTEQTVNNFCKGEGDKVGAKLVQEYNNAIDKSAKSIIEKTENAKTQALVMADSMKQKAILEIYKLVGV